MIPERNVGDLMLDGEVVDAVARGKFHVYPVRTVDEGIAILTGLPAGKPSKGGTYPPNTVHRAVQDRLHEMARLWRDFGKDTDAKSEKNSGLGGRPANRRKRSEEAPARRPRAPRR